MPDTCGGDRGRTAPRLHSHIGTVCREALRVQDLLVRYGGEEFLAVLPNLPAHAVQDAADRLCRAVAGSPLTTPEGGALRATVSIGAAVHPDRDDQPRGTYPPADQAYPAEVGDPHGACVLLLARADAALYAAKHAGRNCTRLAGGPC